MRQAVAPTLVVAGLSARLLAEAAATDGYRVIALDAFGDLDTRRAADRWQPIGATTPRGGPRLDAGRTLEALSEAAAEPGVLGWIAGSDFECEPELLAQAAARLRLLGTPPAAVARLRDPLEFFGALASAGLAHPPTQLARPASPDGWLRKHARGSGGWHIRHAASLRLDEIDEHDAIDADDPPPQDANERSAPAPNRAVHGQPAERGSRGAYFQRLVAGTPCSVLFLAHPASPSGAPAHAQWVGAQHLLVRPLGALPFVYRGAIGPIEPPPAQRHELERALRILASSFALRGLASLDYIDDGERCHLLEVNPRPSASLGLYGAGWIRAHVQACGAAVPPAPPAGPSPAATGPVRGIETVFARRPWQASASAAAALAARADCHDLPEAGARFAAGDPVCSVSADGPDTASVAAALAAKRQALRDAWSER